MKDLYHRSLRNGDEGGEEEEKGSQSDVNVVDVDGSMEEGNIIADESMESSLPSIATPRYQTFPPPLNGARSLTGGFVALDGESVEIPDTDLSHQSDITALTGNPEQEIVFEREEQQSIASSSSSIVPPSVVNISNSLSAFSATMYDNLMTFKILGKDNLTINNRPTLPYNASSSPLPPPPSILRNPLPSKSTAAPSSTVLIALPATRKPIIPKSVVSLASSAWLDLPKLTTPLKEMTMSKKTGATPSTADQSSVDFTTLASQQDCLMGCCPYWVRRSPLWLKLFVFVSTLFFLSASCLIGVAVSLALREGGQSSQREVNQDAIDEMTPPTLPAVAPTGTFATPLPPTFISASTTVATPDSTTSANDPSNSTSFLPNEDETNSTSSNTTVTEDPSSFPKTDMPTFVPTAAPSTAPFPLTFAPTGVIDPSVMEFMVTAGTWDDSVDPAVVLPRLPVRQRQSFLVHLGDWNDKSSDCSEEQYEGVREVWSSSACPVYFIAGTAETAACPNPTAALANWRGTLLEYHRAFWQRVSDTDHTAPMIERYHHRHWTLTNPDIFSNFCSSAALELLG